MSNLPHLEGFWWTPENPDSDSGGRLVWEEDGPRLHLLTRSDEISIFFSGRKYGKYPMIYGRTYDGKVVTLLDCFDLQFSRSLGVEHRVVLVNYVLVGGHVPADNVSGALYHELSTTWKDLNRWFWHSGIEVAYDDEHFNNFTLRHVSHDSIKINLPDGVDLEFSFGTDSIPMGGPLAGENTIQEVVRISVKPPRPQSLSYFLSFVEEIKQFFALCILDYIEPIDVALLGDFDIQACHDGSKVRPHLNLYAVSRRKRTSWHAPHPTDFLVPYSAVKDNFQEVLSAWHRLAEKVSPARSLYFSALYGDLRYIEHTFMSLVQAAEVFHRRHYGGAYLAQDYFEEQLLDPLKAALPEDLATELRKIVIQRLSFINEYSLGKRLKEMARKHRTVVKQYVPHWKSLIRDAVDARNHYTHYSQCRSSSGPSFERLSASADMIKLLIELEMMKESGVALDALHEGALSSQKYRQMFHPSRWADRSSKT